MRTNKMSAKSSPKSRSRKRPPKDDHHNETIAQVHKPIKSDLIQTDPEPITNGIENKIETDSSVESNKTFTIDDQNDNNCNVNITRDMSIESEFQINTKIEKGIIGFMEMEIKKEKCKYNHFTDSRPQSLSFYEEEKAPEELSGQLEQLSPEEKRVLKRRKDERKIDIELDASTYKEIQNVLNREKEDVLLAGMIKSQKSKSRKKKQFDSEESLAGIGDSREQMIPSGKKKTKKSKSKSKESSPSGHKKRHRKRDEFEPKNDITVALEELQDDVFEKDGNDGVYQNDGQGRVPTRSNTVYVQRRNGFEATPRDRLFTAIDIQEAGTNKRFCELEPIELAISVQKLWLPFTVLCHGLLAGLALAHTIVTHGTAMDEEFVKQYQTYAEPYTTAFFFLVVICIISVFDRYDIKHMNYTHLCDLFNNRKSFIVVFVYAGALLVHLVNAKNDDQICLYSYIKNITSNNTIDVITIDNLNQWNALSMWRSLLAICGWIIVALSSNEDMLYGHLSNMEKYILKPS